MTYDKHMRSRALHRVDDYLGSGGLTDAFEQAAKYY